MGAIRIERQGRLAILRMDKARGNAIDAAFVADMTGALRELAEDPGLGGVLLASANPKLFCPGLDLVTLVDYERAAMERFMRSFFEMVLELFSLRRAVVAAVSGHAVAGGCVLALAADHRVLRKGAQIGLNEVRVGIPLPWSVAMLLKFAVSPPAFSRVALLGSNYADEEALALGLAHELQEAVGFEAVCLSRLAEFAERDASALGRTKAYLRASTIREMTAHEAERRGEFLDAWFAPAARERIRATVDALSKKAG